MGWLVTSGSTLFAKVFVLVCRVKYSDSKQCRPRSDISVVVFEIVCYLTYPKYWDTPSALLTCPKIWNIPFYYLLMYLNYCYMYGKQCRPWSDATFSSIFSGSTLFAKVSQYLGLLRYPAVCRHTGSKMDLFKVLENYGKMLWCLKT